MQNWADNGTLYIQVYPRPDGHLALIGKIVAEIKDEKSHVNTVSLTTPLNSVPGRVGSQAGSRTARTAAAAQRH